MDWIKTAILIADKIIKVIKKDLLGKDNGKNSSGDSQTTG